MPQIVQPIGKSSSPVVDKVIQNSHGQQKPVSVPGVTKSGQHNKAPVTVK